MAGEAEDKLLAVIYKMLPDAKVKTKNLQEAVMYLVAEVDKSRRQAGAPAAEGDAGIKSIKDGVERIEKSLQNLKEQFSTMRQYGIGTNAGARI